MRPALLLSLLSLLSVQAASVVVSPAELAEAHRWSAAMFEGVQSAPVPEPALVVLANHGPVQKNARGGRPMHIVDKEYTRGLYCHAPSKIVVRLPGPGARFTAITGVDTNDQTSGGRGSVDFSVKVSGAEKFRSGVMREGMAGKAVAVELDGATEFILQVEETPDGIACDQADWVEARIALKDGSEIWLADLPLREGERMSYTTDPPFSFLYDSKVSADLLKGWKCARASRKLDQHRTERVSVWADPATGLEVRCVGIEYGDFPTVEWVVHFKNTGTDDTPILSDIQAVDLKLARGSSGEFVLNHHAGDNCTPESYEPRQLTLEPEIRAPLRSGRRAAHQRGLSLLQTSWPGEGLMVVIGWPGQWAAQFTRDAGVGVRVRGGQELTRFKLHPGEEARSPLIALQFWQGDRVRAQNIWRRWMLAHNLPRTRDGKLPPPISCFVQRRVLSRPPDQ